MSASSSYYQTGGTAGGPPTSGQHQYAPEEFFGDLSPIEAKNAPESFYLCGDPELLRTGTKVSVVGTRKPSAEGVRRTKVLVRVMVARGITVVSGLAMGIDTVAHATAMALNGKTIAVLGTPLNQCYPQQNRELLAEIKRHHLAVSQFPSNYPVQPKNFPIRNRTMAFISDATVIIEAGEKSGTLHQGWEALRLGRPLFILESVLKDTRLRWPQEMMRYGAQKLSKDNLDRALDHLPCRALGESFDF